MRNSFKIQVQSQEVLKDQVINAGIAGKVQLPSIRIPNIDIEAEVEYKPEEIMDNWSNIRVIIKELPEFVEDCKKAGQKIMELLNDEDEGTVNKVASALMAAASEIKQNQSENIE